VRKNARRRLESSSEHAALELLTHDTNRKLFPVLASLDPGGTIDAANPTPGRELFLLILRGTIEIDDDVTPPIQLEKGDAAWFADDRHRRLRNRSTTRAEWVAVTTPPPL
jgi:quercetin dioxygenase-like cupin family protein